MNSKSVETLCRRVKQAKVRVSRLVKTALTVWLMIVMVLPPRLALAQGPISPLVAVGTVPSTPNPPSNPLPCGFNPTGTCTNNPGPGTSCNPVYFRYGTAIESETDIGISGPAFGWQLSRSYVSNGVGTSSLGSKWLSDSNDMYLIQSGSNVSLLVNAFSQIVFTGSGTPVVYSAQSDSDFVLTADTANKWLILTDTVKNLRYKFNDFTVTTVAHRGKLIEESTLEWNTQTKTGTEYSYDSNGRVTQVTTSEGQDYSIAYTYNGGGFITKVEIQDGSSNVLQRAEYVYYQDVTSPTSDLGTTNDLVQVKVSKRATKDTTSPSIVRYTQYRYAGTTSRLKAVYEHDAIQRAMSAHSLSTPEALMQKADTFSTPSVQSFASRSFEYYTSSSTTSSINTPFASGEDLNTLYGGSELNEDTYVKSETVNGCGSCGTAGSVKRTYFYMTLANSTSDPNQVTRLVVEDKQDSSGTPVSRTIYGLEDKGRVLREVLIQDPTGTPKYWCESWKFTTSSPAYRIDEHRMPSAHNVTSASALRNFLNPYNGSSWSNDTGTLNSTDGLIQTFGYNAVGQQTDEKVKKGSSGTAYFVSAKDYDSTNPALVTASYDYPAQTTTRSAGIQTTFSYTFWDSDNRQIKSRTTTLPTISSGQNGSGVATTTAEYFDSFGRLRWTRDGEGYINYYSYHPTMGQTALQIIDVDPASPGTDVTSGSAGNWEDWTVGDADDTGSKPTRDSGLPTPLALSTKTYFDSQGRQIKSLDQGGASHFIAYENLRTIRFPYWDSTNSKTLLPTQVSKLNDAAQESESFSVKATYTSFSTSSGSPTGFSTEPTQSDYVSWMKRTYDSNTGKLLYADRYANIPSSGTGTLSTDFYRQVAQYDTLGRVQYEIDVVQGSSSSDRVEQVIQKIYDIKDRLIEVKQGVSGDTAANSHDMTSSYTSYPTLRTILKNEYDGGGVGDGFVTKRKEYFGTGTNDFTGVNLKLTYRGAVRGMERFYMNGATETPTGPYLVSDIDWLGRSTTTAIFDTAPTWATVLTGDGYSAYAASTSTNRRSREDSLYDDLGRVFQKKMYEISSSSGSGSNYSTIIQYYDRNNQIVARSNNFRGGEELAYDGNGRVYQQRQVNDLSSTLYSSGKYQYRSPAPNSNIGAMSGGDDEVLSITHSVFDSSGNLTGTHAMEVNHQDLTGGSVGVDLTNNDDYIRATSYIWYDTANRVVVNANYGSGDTASGAGTWKYTTIPTRPGTAPTASSDTTLATLFSYNADTGNQDVVTDPSGVKTKTFSDSLGRPIYSTQNWDDFSGSSETGTGDSSDKSKDRVIKKVFDANGGIRQLVFMDPDGDGSLSDNQVTKYLFEDPIDVRRTTSEIYPDSSDTSSSGTDQVKLVFNLDGSLSQATDQLGTVINYTYTPARKLEITSATTLGTNVDGAVRSIKHTYDNMLRVQNVTSYSGTSGTGAVVNDVRNVYDDFSEISEIYQSHSGAVNTSTTAKVQFGHDTSLTGNVFTSQRRMNSITYPNGRAIFYDYESTANTPYHRNSMLRKLRETNSTGNELAVYDRTGQGRVAIVDLTEPDIKLDQYQGTSGIYAGRDRFGRVKDQYWDGYGSTSDADRIRYTYDYLGTRTSRDIDIAIYPTDDKDSVYSYDGLRRLKNSQTGTLLSGSISGTPANEKSWTLDGLGNWGNYVKKTSGTTDLNQTRTVNASNEISNITESTGLSWANPAYDSVGNMTAIPKPSDLTGTYSATYDAWNRLVKLQDGVNTVSEFEYDGRNYRTVQKSYASGTLSETRHYYYDSSWRVIEERTGASPDSANANRQFVWGTRYIDELVLRDRDTNGDGSLDERLYALQDASWNTTSVVNASGVVQERYDYTPYGDVTFLTPSFGNRSSSAMDWEILYSGYRFDFSCGMLNSRYRYLHPSLGNWISRDPIGFQGGLNLYGYVDCSPLSQNDASGLACSNSVKDRGDLGEGCSYIKIPMPNKSLPFAWPGGLILGPTAVSTITFELSQGYGSIVFCPRKCSIGTGEAWLATLSMHLDLSYNETVSIGSKEFSSLPKAVKFEGKVTVTANAEFSSTSNGYVCPPLTFSGRAKVDIDFKFAASIEAKAQALPGCNICHAEADLKATAGFNGKLRGMIDVNSGAISGLRLSDIRNETIGLGINIYYQWGQNHYKHKYCIIGTCAN